MILGADTGKDLPPSGSASRFERSADQEAKLSIARHRLRTDVIGFLQTILTPKGEAELGHKPQSEDLVPFFHRYAWTLVRVHYENRIASFSSQDELRISIEKFIPRAIAAICNKGTIEDGSIRGGGTWWRTVDRACNAVNLGVRQGRFGTYDRFAFLHPNRTQLRALLLADAHELMTEFWQHRAKLETAADENPPGAVDAAVPSSAAALAVPSSAADAGAEYPKRAAWLQDRLAERKWSLSTFDKKDLGITRRTVSNIAKGKHVARLSLAKLAHALSGYKDLPRVEFKDIPIN